MQDELSEFLKAAQNTRVSVDVDPLAPPSPYGSYPATHMAPPSSTAAFGDSLAAEVMMGPAGKKDGGEEAGSFEFEMQIIKDRQRHLEIENCELKSSTRDLSGRLQRVKVREARLHHTLEGDSRFALQVILSALPKVLLQTRRIRRRRSDGSAEEKDSGTKRKLSAMRTGAQHLPTTCCHVPRVNRIPM